MASTIPSTKPSSKPSSRPSRAPSNMPSPVASGRPSTKPSVDPSSGPTIVASTRPSTKPSSKPSSRPSRAPSNMPSLVASGRPSTKPSVDPSSGPTIVASARPSTKPSSKPSSRPSREPSNMPSPVASGRPSTKPSVDPSSRPSSAPSPDVTSGMVTVAACIQRASADRRNVACHNVDAVESLILDAPESYETCGCCNNRYQWTPQCDALSEFPQVSEIVAACCQRPIGTTVALPSPSPAPTIGYSPSDSLCMQKGSVSQWSVICYAETGMNFFRNGLPLVYGPLPDEQEGCGCCNGRFESTPSCNALPTTASAEQIFDACCRRGLNSPSTTPSRSPSTKPSARPSVRPSRSPTTTPSGRPSQSPSVKPSVDPSPAPVPTPSSGPTTGLWTINNCFQRASLDTRNVVCDNGTTNRLTLDAPENLERCGCCNGLYEWSASCDAIPTTASSTVIHDNCCQRSPTLPLATPTPTPAPTTGITGLACATTGGTGNWNLLCHSGWGQNIFRTALPGAREGCGCCNGRYEWTPECGAISSMSATTAEINTKCCQRVLGAELYTGGNPILLAP